MVSLEPFWYFSGQKIDPSNCVFFVCLTFSPKIICHLDGFGKGAAIVWFIWKVKASDTDFSSPNETNYFFLITQNLWAFYSHPL